MALESHEMLYLDENGRKQDAELWANLLDDPEASESAALGAVLRAIEGGMSEADALALFGNSLGLGRFAAHRKALSAA